MSDDAPWLPLAEAETRCMRGGVPPGGDFLSNILTSGLVPVRGRRSGNGRADPIEDLLKRADQRRSYSGPVSVLWASNEITVLLDTSSTEHRRVAAELYEKHHGRIPVPGMPELLGWLITFKDVRVHWPKLVEELQANGFKSSLESGLPPSRTRQPRKAASLRPAGDGEIHKAITLAYDNTDVAGQKPPNIKEIVAPVQAILREGTKPLATAFNNWPRMPGMPSGAASQVQRWRARGAGNNAKELQRFPAFSHREI